MSLTDWLSLLSSGGPWLVLAAFCAAILWAGRRGIWVWGREAERANARAEKYEGLYEGTRVLLVKALDASEAQVATLQTQNELLERLQRSAGTAAAQQEILRRIGGSEAVP